jgi:hypothetical protein
MSIGERGLDWMEQKVSPGEGVKVVRHSMRKADFGLEEEGR